MFKKLKFLPIILLVVMVSCDKAPPAGKSVANKPGAPTAGPIDYGSEGANLASAEFGDMTFTSPELRSTVLRWQKAIDRTPHGRLTQSPWLRLCSSPPPDPNSKTKEFVKWWSSVPHLMRPDASVKDRAYSEKTNRTILSISCNVQDQKTSRVWLARIAAQQYSADRWFARFQNSSYGPAKRSFPELDFSRAETATSPYLHYKLLPGLWEWSATATFDKVQYQFGIALPEVYSQHKKERLQQLEARVRALSDSTDSFRATCQSIVTDLEQLMANELPSARAVRSAISKEVIEVPTTPYSPPTYSDAPSDRPLKAEEWQSVLDAAREDLAERRKFIDEHYVGLHAALVALFPVHELLEPLEP